MQIKVIKLGGSLMSNKVLLMDCLGRIAKIEEPTVIVPGGGVFADLVRKSQQQWHFNEQIAHQMAILAMQQSALLFHSLQPQFGMVNRVAEIKKQFFKQPVVIWCPDIEELNQAKIEASWDVTSDSLSAWLASYLAASDLILVKSTEIPATADLDFLQKMNVVDAAFNEFVINTVYKISVINHKRFNESFFI